MISPFSFGQHLSFYVDPDTFYRLYQLMTEMPAFSKQLAGKVRDLALLQLRKKGSL